jgi:serine/threonine protein kinase
VDRPLGSKYMLHDQLGRGAMGQVFRGTVRETGAPVAVKILKPELVSDTEVVARFFQERAILTSISDPHVAGVIDLVVEGDTLGIVMELVAGKDLRHHLRERRTLPPAEAVALVRQLLQGLVAVHAAGIVHRDVKPENVLMDSSGAQANIKITDFGVARLSYGASLTKLTSLIGTPEYMAPELADHDSATPAADIYSAGIILYEMLAGRTPFAGGYPLAVLRRQIEQAPPVIPGLPPELWAQIVTMLSKDPRQRQPSAAAAAGRLESLEPLLTTRPALPPMTLPASPAQTPAAASVPAPAAAPAVSPADGEDPLSSWYRPPSQTVLRHRDRAHQPTGPVGRAATPARTSVAPGPSSWFRRRPAVLAIPAVLVVLAAALGLVLVRTLQPAARPQSPAIVSYAFAPQEYHDGLLIVRRWTLSGKNGSLLTETVTASSATGKPIRVPFTDAIPGDIATTLQTVRFRPIPSQVVKADPVVEWKLQLPAQGAVPVGYQATVRPDGASQARLQRWVKLLDAMQATLKLPQATTIPIHSLRITPGRLRVPEGATTRLTLAGQLGNGTSAPDGILSGAAWTSQNPGVAVVNPSGDLVATGPGTTTVTAQLGGAKAQLTVTVAGGGSGQVALGGAPTPNISGSAGGQPAATAPNSQPSSPGQGSTPASAPSSAPPTTDPATTQAAPPPSPSPLDADATPAFGTCPSPTPSDEAYCGGWSSACYNSSFSQSNCPTYVAQGTTVHPICWAYGQTINNSYSAVSPGSGYTLQSNIWIQVSDYPSDPWMNELWFNPDDTTSDNIPEC